MLTDDLLIYGVPHSGTSVIAKMYETLGWNFPVSSTDECLTMEPWFLNRICIALGSPEPIEDPDWGAFLYELKEIPKRSAMKDNKLCVVLPRLQGAILDNRPNTTLIWICRDLGAVPESTELRKENGGWWGLSVFKWWQCALDSYVNWPGRKVVVWYEDVREAVSLHRVQLLRDAMHVTNENVDRAMDVFNPKRENSDHCGKRGWKQ